MVRRGWISLLCLVMFFGSSAERTFAEEMDFSVLGNTMFYAFVGKNNHVGVSFRNLMFRGEFGREFFYAKGELDLSAHALNFYTERANEDISAVPEFLASPVPQDQVHVRVREMFVSTRGLPLIRVTLGRIFGRVGGANSESFWDRKFVERPCTIRTFFGQDGFLDEGIELSFSPPLPWTLEIVGQLLDGSEKSWNSKGSADLVWLISIANGFGDEKVGGGFEMFWTAGKNDSAQRLSLKKNAIVSENMTEYFGGDVFFNYNPVFSLRVGYMISRVSKPMIRDIEGGLYTEFSVRPVDFFQVSIRPEIFGIPRTREEESAMTNQPQVFELSIALDLIHARRAKLRTQWTGNFGEKRLPQNIIYLQGMFNID